jgi:hypothetical protein
VLTNADELAGDYVVTPIEVPDDLGSTALSIEALPPNWDAGQSTSDTADVGTDWARSLTTAVLVVRMRQSIPSVQEALAVIQ